MPSAAIYTRISRDTEGLALGVERQELDCRALATRDGLTVAAVYSDNDMSASGRSRKPRPAYLQMLADARAGMFGVIIAATSSRLTRQPREFEDLLDLHREGIRFRYVSSPDYDLGTADGRMTARIAANVDAAEADRASERIRRKIAERTAAGLPHGGYRPYGWEPDRLTIREAEAGHIRYAVAQLLGGLPVRAVVRGLDERGSRNTRGGEWRHTTLRKMLLAPRHAGLMRDGSPASWPAIIAPDTHKALVRLLGDPARVTTPGSRGARHLLSGLATCGVCHGPMRVGKSSSRNRPAYYVYRCTRNHCVVRNRDHIEGLVLEVIATYLRDPEKMRHLLALDADDAAGAARRAASERAETVRRQLDEAAADHATSGLSLRELAAYTAPLRAELAALEAASTPPPDRAAALGSILTAKDRGAAFLAAPVERQRAVVDMLVTIEIGRGRRGNTFDPHGIEIDWR